MNGNTQSANLIGSTQSAIILPLSQDSVRRPEPDGSAHEKSSRTNIQLVAAEASTELSIYSEIHYATLAAELESLFTDAKTEEFTDGTESNFSRNLISFIGKHQDIAIKLLSGSILSRRTNSEAAAEALRWIGYIYHPKTFRYRLWLLINSLNSSSLRVRDGALLGLAFMDTTKAIPALEKAARAETSELLKVDMIELVGYLKTRLHNLDAA